MDFCYVDEIYQFSFLYFFAISIAHWPCPEHNSMLSGTPLFSLKREETLLKSFLRTAAFSVEDILVKFLGTTRTDESLKKSKFSRTSEEKEWEGGNNYVKYNLGHTVSVVSFEVRGNNQKRPLRFSWTQKQKLVHRFRNLKTKQINKNRLLFVFMFNFKCVFEDNKSNSSIYTQKRRKRKKKEKEKFKQ